MLQATRTRSRLPERACGTSGQALVEFALILIPLLLIFLGILQFGILLSAQVGLINSTREGARYGATLVSSGSAADAATVYCYTLGMQSDGTACSIGGVPQPGTLGRSMAGYNKNQVCLASGGNCGLDSSSVTYCYFADPNGTTYSLRLNVTVVYRHPLFIPLISAIVDTIDGSPDSALRAGTTEYFRVEGPSFTAAPPGVSLCTT